MALPSSRTHRTALVIDVRKGMTTTGAERVRRLLESVNDSNIKVDVLTLRGNTAATGPSLVKGSPFDTEGGDFNDDIDLEVWARNLGYDQLVISIPLG